MKRRPLIATAGLPALFLLIFAGCMPQSENSTGPAAEAQSSAGEEGTPNAPAIAIPATITYDGLWFREELDGAGVRQLDVGEKVTAIGAVEADPGNSDRKYVPIRLEDGTEGWASEWFTVIETVPGVLVDEAKIYSEPKLSKLTSNPALEPMKIVAVGEEGETGGFVRVSYATEEGYAKLDEYVKASFVSYDENDILAAHLYQLAMKAENEDMKAEFLDSASQVGSPAFATKIRQALNGEMGTGTSSETMDFVIAGPQGAAAYENPDIGTPVLAEYSEGDVLPVVNRSKTKKVVGGNEDWWYELEEGGWVFGASVSGD